MTLSRSAYARHRRARGLPGATHVAVLKAIKAGRIPLEPDGTIDPATADAAWAANTDAAKRRPAPPRAGHARPAPSRPADGGGAVDGGPPPPGGPSYAQSRAIREAYAARLAKLDYEERTGAVVRTETVKLGWFAALRVLRDRLLALPDRLAPLLAAEDDPRRVQEALRAELRAVLADAADRVAGLGEAER